MVFAQRLAVEWARVVGRTAASSWRGGLWDEATYVGVGSGSGGCGDGWWRGHRPT